MHLFLSCAVSVVSVNNWFTLSMHILSYGCMREVWRVGEKHRVARGATESKSSFLSVLQTSQVYPLLDIRTLKA